MRTIRELGCTFQGKLDTGVPSFKDDSVYENTKLGNRYVYGMNGHHLQPTGYGYLIPRIGADFPYDDVK